VLARVPHFPLGDLNEKRKHDFDIKLELAQRKRLFREPDSFSPQISQRVQLRQREQWLGGRGSAGPGPRTFAGGAHGHRHVPPESSDGRRQRHGSARHPHRKASTNGEYTLCILDLVFKNQNSFFNGILCIVMFPIFENTPAIVEKTDKSVDIQLKMKNFNLLLNASVEMFD